MRVIGRLWIFGCSIAVGLVVVSVMAAAGRADDRLPAGSVSPGNVPANAWNYTWFPPAQSHGSGTASDPFGSLPYSSDPNKFGTNFSHNGAKSTQSGIGFDIKTDREIDLEKLLPDENTTKRDVFSGNQLGGNPQKKGIPFIGLSIGGPLN